MYWKQKTFTLFVVLLLTALACSIPPLTPSTIESPAGAVETSVAQTLAAAASSPITTATPTIGSPPAAPPPVHIVYVDNGNLWLWTESGGSVMLYSGETVSEVLLSPDGNLVAFVTIAPDYSVLGLWRVRTDGTDLQRLISGPDFIAMSANPDALGADPYRLQFIPGTHILAFNTNLIFEGPGLLIQDDIRMLDMDTGSLSVFLTVGSGGNFYFSPDGSRLVFTNSDSVNVIRTDGMGRVDDVLTFPFVNTASEFAFYPSAQWAGDSSKFWVVIPSPEPFGPAANFELFEVSADGSGSTSLGVFPGTFSHFPDGTALSPDGRFLAYMQQTAGGQDLRIVELGISDVVVDNQVGGFSGWDPGSGHLIYQKDGSLRIVQPGGAPALLEGSPAARNAEWLNDGRYLYTNGSFGSFTLRLGSPGSGSLLVASPIADFVTYDAIP